MPHSVVVITLNYNQNDFTLSCIKSLLESDYESYKVLLIDNGSTDENFNRLKNILPRDENILLKRIENNRGYVGGINYGLEEGTKLQPDYFLIMNNDAILDYKAIGELVKTCKDYDNKAIVSGKVFNLDEPNKLQYVGSKLINAKTLEYALLGVNEVDNGQYDLLEERDMLDDIFWLFPKKMFDEIGYYSDYFWFNAEQQDFALRAMERGYKLVYNPKAMLWHKGSVSIGGRDFNPIHAYWITQSELIVRKLHLVNKDFKNYYLKVMLSILITYLKTPLLLLKGINRISYANAKLKGFLSFNNWNRKPSPNNGTNPFLKR